MFDKTKAENDQTVVPPGGGTVEDNGHPDKSIWGESSLHQTRGAPGRWGDEGVGVGGVMAIEAEQGVEVDRSAGLVFSGLAVGDAGRGHGAVVAVAAVDPDQGQAAEAGEVA